jgi:hypothetical protein
MRKRLMLVAVIACTLLAAASPGLAQTSASNDPVAALTAQVNQLNGLIDSTVHTPMKQYLISVRDQANEVLGSGASQDDLQKTGKAVQYALKLASDTRNEGDGGLWADTPFVVYEAPALSPVMRLPDTLPEDGVVSDRISVVSAQNEYEASSFVLAPVQDANAVTFTVSDLNGKGGTIPSEAVDLKVVKTWYQGGTAWQSYFFDDYKDVLTPELLLNDENLIKVDDATKHNFLRVDYPTGSKYVDVSGSPPAPFNMFNEPVADSPVLLPISLKQGQSKQMWVTTKVPKGTPEGIYTGTIAITTDGVPAGQLTLQIRVLPFELPSPKTYYDLNKDFYVMLYHGSRVLEYMNDTHGNAALVDEKLLNEYRDMAEHNAVNIPGPLYNTSTKDYFLHQLDLMEEAGLSLNPLFGVKQAFPPYDVYNRYTDYLSAKKIYDAAPTDANKQVMDQKYSYWMQGVNNYLPTLDEAYQVASQRVGHTNLYFDGWDEAGMTMLQQEQPTWQYVKEHLGAKIFATGNASHLTLPIKEDFINWAGIIKPENAAAWHATGTDKMITNYAYPHIGPENPALMRQRHGMWLYKANYDATYNYAWYYVFINPWGDYVDATYRGFNFVYPTQKDVIDTIAWEGFREGVDDIKYATKLQEVAQDALASGDAGRIDAANKALAWLQNIKVQSSDSDYVRSEMIHQIMTMLDSAHAE